MPDVTTAPHAARRATAAALALLALTLLLAATAPVGASAATRSCATIRQPGNYRVAVQVRGVTCPAARSLYNGFIRRRSFPRGAVVQRTGVWGKSFRQGSFTCRRRSAGLLGTAYDLRCTARGGRVASFSRRGMR